MAEYYEDGFTYARRQANLRVESDYKAAHSTTRPERWAPGRYGVYVHKQGCKIAEVAFAVTP